MNVTRALAALGLLAFSACGGGGEEPADNPCGNGTLEAPEQCDDGNNADGDGCNSICFNEAVCGNGTVDPGEGCDDGNTTPGDDCDAACQIEQVVGEVCGNGVQEGAEQCDDGNTTPDDGCSSDCMTEPGVCGDNTLNTGEECDDGNTADGDGCSSTCTTEASCGDGTVDADEECDDGNNVDGDGCEADCTLVPGTCGDGNVDAAAGEQCDNGAANSNTDADACREDCMLASCGDDVVDTGEDCDGGDDCQADCSISAAASCLDADAIDLAVEGTPAGGGFRYTFESSAVTADLTNVASCTRSVDSVEVTVLFTATQAGWYVARTDSPATTADTVITVNSGDCANPTLVACNDNQLDGTSSLVTWVAEAGVSYPIVIDALSAGAVTVEVVSIQAPGINGSPCPQGLCDAGLACVSNLCQPPAGTCGTALEGSDILTGDFSTGLSGTVTLDGRSALQTGSCGGAGTEVVIRLVPDAEGELRVTATGNGFSTSTYLRRTCGSSVGELACATDSVVSATVRDGQAYFVIIDSDDTVGGSVQVDVEIVPFSLLGESCDAEAPCVEGTTCNATSSLCSLPPALDGESCVPDDVTQACAADLTCADVGAGAGICVGSLSGTCAEPEAATLAGTVVTVTNDATIEYETPCGFDTGTVLSYEMASSATLLVRATREDGLIVDTQVTLRQGCEDAEAQTSCAQNEGAANVAAFDALAGETVYILVGGAAGDVRVSAREVPTAAAGELCDLAGLSTRCEQDFFCSDFEICEPNAGNTCARPKSINEQSTGALLNGTLEATIRTEWPVSLQEGSCGGAGTEGVLTYRAETSGEFTFTITDSSVDVTIYVRETCRDEESEVACGEVETPTVTVDLLAGQEVFLV
ncbi:MAG: cysteine-rich repeat protein, partial [Bradymonadia bacterium]